MLSWSQFSSNAVKLPEKEKVKPLKIGLHGLSIFPLRALMGLGAAFRGVTLVDMVAGFRGAIWIKSDLII